MNLMIWIWLGAIVLFGVVEAATAGLVSIWFVAGALAALIAFYRGERDGESYPVQDDADWISRYQTLWARHRDGQMSTRELVTAVLSVADHWQQDLSQIPGLVELVTADLDAILTCGMRDAVKPLC